MARRYGGYVSCMCLYVCPQYVHADEACRVWLQGREERERGGKNYLAIPVFDGLKCWAKHFVAADDGNKTVMQHFHKILCLFVVHHERNRHILRRRCHAR